MRVILIYTCAALLFLSCSANRQSAEKMKELSLLDEKEASGWRMRLNYLPSNPRDTTDWSLVLRVEHESGLPQQIINEPRFSFGIDSLFEVITSMDTLAPYMAIRIANGMTNGAEYMLTFNRQSVLKNGDIQLRFKDWLFSQRELYFPVNMISIHQLDSIYSRI
ncbi:hypothetical protein WJU16_00845 [Chitinophaga pollutisoli]|uniref:Uncharacterized protein n=1 Tax=Chitinophaga pollutisoli TaxID=3133966 RepID=A0ABZ2YRW6_9BACT